MGGYLAVVLALLAWLLQFVAWRRAVVAKEQLEQVRSLARHPVYRNEKLAGWVRSAESR